MRAKWVGFGIILFVAWLANWAITVVPGSRAVVEQWVAGNALAFFSGIAFGKAWHIKAAHT